MKKWLMFSLMGLLILGVTASAVPVLVEDFNAFDGVGSVTWEPDGPANENSRQMSNGTGFWWGAYHAGTGQKIRLSRLDYAIFQTGAMVPGSYIWSPLDDGTTTYDLTGSAKIILDKTDDGTAGAASADLRIMIRVGTEWFISDQVVSTSGVDIETLTFFMSTATWRSVTSPDLTAAEAAADADEAALVIGSSASPGLSAVGGFGIYIDNDRSSNNLNILNIYVEAGGANQPPVVAPTANPQARPASPATPIDPAHPVEGEGIHVGRGSVPADPNLATSLDAGAVDPDGDAIAAYAWSVFQAPAGADPLVYGFNDDTIAAPIFSADPNVLGDYILEVAVTAATGNTTPSTAQVTVTVLDNWAPHAAIPGNTGPGNLAGDNNEPDEMYYDENSLWNLNTNDPEGDVLAYFWTVTDPGGDATINFSPSETVEDPNVAVTVNTTIPAAAGNYTLRAEVSDGQYITAATDDVTVFDNLAPTVEAGDDQIINLTDGGATLLAGVVTDDVYPKPHSLTTGWTVLSKDPAGAADPTFTPDASEPNVIATFTEVGVYILELSADDGSGAVTDSVTITVDPKPYGRIDLSPEEDTWVFKRAAEDSQYRISNLGGADEARLAPDDVPTPDDDARIGRAIFRFDLDEAPGAVKGATLTITASQIPDDPNRYPSDTLQVKAVTYANSGSPYNGPWLNGTDTTWSLLDTDDDPLLTWNNQYSWLVYGAVLDTAAPPADEESVDLHVGDLVIEEGYKANLAVMLTSTVPGDTGRGYRYHLNEASNAAKRPVLAVVYDPNEAYHPTPADGKTEIDPSTDLSYMPGMVASTSNTVYIGTDPDPFANPEFSIPVSKGATDPNEITLDISSQYPDGLAENTMYYWGVNNGGTDSQIWLFTTQLVSDLSGDGVVNLVDFALLAQGWQTTYDINDLKAMAAVWLFGT